VVRDPRSAGLAQVAPHTVDFLFRSWARSRQPGGPDTLPGHVSAALAAQVALDEVVISVMKHPRMYPHRSDYVRGSAETLEAVALFGQNGWLDDPAGYHGRPPPVGYWHLEPARTRGLAYERLTFASGYEPHPGEPGRDRWLAHEANRTAHAWVLRHRHGDRPWVVCLHGFGMGMPLADFQGFRVGTLYRDLGLNLILPVLPLHGPRRSGGGASGDGFMSFDLIDTVHALAQSAWDVRRIVGWLRSTLGASEVGLYGLSLGAYVTALTASLEDGLACAIAGIPAVDIPDLFAHHAPARLRRRAREHHLLGEESRLVNRVVSPLAMPARVPFDRRFIFAGVGDRMATPTQARRLWEHWDRPRIAWYNGGHVGFFWSREVSQFVQEALSTALPR